VSFINSQFTGSLFGENSPNTDTNTDTGNTGTSNTDTSNNKKPV
jgi:hypothetical protein